MRANLWRVVDVDPARRDHGGEHFRRGHAGDLGLTRRHMKPRVCKRLHPLDGVVVDVKRSPKAVLKNNPHAVIVAQGLIARRLVGPSLTSLRAHGYTVGARFKRATWSRGAAV